MADNPFPVRGREVQALEDEEDGLQVGPEEDMFAEVAPPSTEGAEEGQLVNREGVSIKEQEIDIMQADIREEARKAKGVGIPSTPGPGKVEAHNLLHIPYRAWCGWCVMSRGQDNQHHVLDEERKMLHMDYYFHADAL